MRSGTAVVTSFGIVCFPQKDEILFTIGIILDKCALFVDAFAVFSVTLG